MNAYSSHMNDAFVNESKTWSAALCVLYGNKVFNFVLTAASITSCHSFNMAELLSSTGVTLRSCVAVVFIKYRPIFEQNNSHLRGDESKQ